MESVFGIILKVHYESVGDTAATEVLGKTMLDWVKLSLGEEVTAVAVDYDEKTEIPAQVKHYADAGKKYTVVLFSDTPLITKKTVTDAVAVAENGNLNVVKMTRGYVFRTAFLTSCEKLYTDSTHYFTEEDFLTASTPHNLALITDVMRNRILRYHADRGVRFFRPRHYGSGGRRCDSRGRENRSAKHIKGQNRNKRRREPVIFQRARRRHNRRGRGNKQQPHIPQLHRRAHNGRSVRLYKTRQHNRAGLPHRRLC